MRKKLQKRNSEGFTIIEVMIVLAIAALILLIVLLAVPALQRNSRNTTIKNDASSVAGAVNTYESDNNGKLPVNIAGTGTVQLSGDKCSATAGTTAPEESINVNGSTIVSCVSGPPKTVDPSNIEAVIGQTCEQSSDLGSGKPGATSARAVALYYSVETSGSPSLQCIDT